MKKRLFIAIIIPVNLQEKIGLWEQSLRFQLPVRWLALKNLHLTLIPPWYEEDLNKIYLTLDTLPRISFPVKITFSQVCFGPNAHQPRLIWAIGETPGTLTSLQKKLWSLLPHLSSEKRPLRMHLTLARFRPEQFDNFPIKNWQEKIDWQTNVTSVVLMQSHLSKTGADYEILKEYQLF